MKLQASEELHRILSSSRDEAMRTGSYSISPDHIFLAILRNDDSSCYQLLASEGISPREMKEFIDEHIFTHESIAYSDSNKIEFSRESQNMLNFAVLECARLSCRKITSLHLLLSVLRMPQTYSYIYLHSLGLDYEQLLLSVKTSLLDEASQDQESDKEDEKNSIAEVVFENVHSEEKPQSDEKTTLEKYSIDLTEAARIGATDPLVGREREIMQVIQTLGRRKKNNAILVGEPGVGKSAIVEGIASMIANGTAPESIKDKRILSLDMASIVAGTRYRGDFEKRLKDIIAELSAKPEIIIFIDEFHTVVGTGAVSGGLDAANMLKPALANGQIRCIAATSNDEYSRIVEKDSALGRRFQKIAIEPTNEPETVKILQELRERYEEHHDVIYSDEAIVACVRMTERYIHDRCLPDKAIDAMDEAGAMVRLRHHGQGASKIEIEDVAAAVSLLSNVPLTKVAEEESVKLLNMGERLKAKVIGQDEAIDTVVRAIRRSRTGIRDPRRPVGSFIFFGQTGVGKTLLAKALAEELFGSQDCLTRIDMSEYTEKFAVSRLVGAPPGYVGFNEGGQLTEAARRKPYGVILLDEIEKAHPDVYNILLQVIDEGRLTDGGGRTADLRNSILIMTSNAGSKELESYGKGIGFDNSARNLDEMRKNVVKKAIKRTFPPEFINRIDEQVFFRALNREDLTQIIDLELNKLRDRVREEGYALHIPAKVKEFVADAGYDPSFGARPLARAIQRYIEDPIAEELLRRNAAGRKCNKDGKKLEKITLKLSKDSSRVEVVKATVSSACNL